MDGRYLVLGLALLLASLAVYGLGWSRSLWAWGLPFALMLLFLSAIGESPTARVKHLVPGRE